MFDGGGRDFILSKKLRNLLQVSVVRATVVIVTGGLKMDRVKLDFISMGIVIN